MNNFWIQQKKTKFFLSVFLYRKIADIERNWSVADESTNVSDSQYASDAQVIASNYTTVPTIGTTTSQNDAGRSENMEN